MLLDENELEDSESFELTEEEMQLCESLAQSAVEEAVRQIRRNSHHNPFEIDVEVRQFISSTLPYPSEFNHWYLYKENPEAVFEYEYYQ